MLMIIVVDILARGRIKKRGAKCNAPAGRRGSEEEEGGKEGGGRGSSLLDSQEAGEVREARERMRKGLKGGKMPQSI